MTRISDQKLFRFLNPEYALAQALYQICNNPGTGALQSFAKADHLVSYDIACAYCVHVVERFQKMFPDLVNVVSNIRWLIPLVHVQNHKEICTYLFSSAYTPNAGHFHGETAEHIWPESNQLGPQTRQMNNGHCQDTIIDHHNDWNWKKMSNLGMFIFILPLHLQGQMLYLLATTLQTDIIRAKSLFLAKWDAFKNLTNLYLNRVQDWNNAD